MPSFFFPISFSDTTYNSVFYFGTVLNRPSIRESINLANSTAKNATADSGNTVLIEELFPQNHHLVLALYAHQNNS